jgi:hypothetical protein
LRPRRDARLRICRPHKFDRLRAGAALRILGDLQDASAIESDAGIEHGQRGQDTHAKVHHWP